MIICKKKQIQSRKPGLHFKNSLQTAQKTHSAFTKDNFKVKNQLNFSQKSQSIDPWFINSNFSNANFKNIINQQTFSKVFKIKNSFSSNLKNNHSQNKNNTIFEDKYNKNSHNQLEEFPLEDDMLQCSIRFQQYELQKAQELKSILMQKPPRKKVNYLQKNINNAFNLNYDKTSINFNPQKKRIIQQTKQQLILNKQKLQQQSKQLQKVILMKEDKHILKPKSKSQNHTETKTQILSSWKMIYLEKQKNYIQKNNRKYQLNINQWKKFFKKQEKTTSFNIQTNNFLVDSNFFRAKTSHKQIIDKQKNQKNRDSNSLTKKIARIWKLKNKSSLVFQATNHENICQQKNEIGKTHFHHRIHSMNCWKSDCPNTKNIFKQGFSSSGYPQIFSQFETSTNSALFEQQKNQITKMNSKNKFSPTSQKQQSQHSRQKRKNLTKNLISNEKRKVNSFKQFYIEGSPCQIRKTIY